MIELREQAAPPWVRADTILLCAVTALGGVARYFYVSGLEWSPYDPWRHLLLVRHLREGLGFTIFVDQPYIWYQPPWYWLCAWMPETVGPQWVAAVFSLACVPAMYLWVRREAPVSGRFAATFGALLMAGYGPLIKFTCQYGPEAFALFLLLASVLLARSGRGLPSGLAAGLLFGIALVARMNYLFAGLLFLPELRRRWRALVLALGAAIPLGLTWLRNFRILGERDWVFTWDGLATPSRSFNVLSTLVIQMQPDVGEGLRRLHQVVLSKAEWLTLPELTAFMVLVGIAVLAARRWGVALTVIVALAYFTLLDRSGTAHSFRIWTGVLPAMFAALAISAARLRAAFTWGAYAGAAWVAAALALGIPFAAPPQGAAPYLRTDAPISLEMATPPPELLTEDRYLVNSAFLHPESVVFRFPEKRFLGLPLNSEEFAAFQRAFPDYRHILWHDFGVQTELLRYLVDSGRYEIVRQATNVNGLRYLVLSPTVERDGSNLSEE